MTARYATLTKAMAATGTREEIEDWIIAQLPDPTCNPAFEMDDDPYTLNIWGPTEEDGLCPLLATFDLFTNQLRICS